MEGLIRRGIGFTGCTISDDNLVYDIKCFIKLWDIFTDSYDFYNELLMVLTLINNSDIHKFQQLAL